MRIWKSSLLIIGISVLVLSSMTAVAETESDTQGDVWHFIWPYWQEQTVNNQPNLDIKEIKAEISGDQITLSKSLCPVGTISRSDKSYVMYKNFYNAVNKKLQKRQEKLSDEGEEPLGSSLGISLDGTYLPPMSSAEVIVNGDTISATMDKVGDNTTTVEMYGVAWMYEEYYGEQLTHDQWHDWIGDYIWDPDTGDNGDGNDNGDTNGGTQQPPPSGTPGFETLAVIASLGIAFIFLRKRK